MRTLKHIEECITVYKKKLNLVKEGWKITLSCNEDIDNVKETDIHMTASYNPSTKVADIEVYTDKEAMTQLKNLDEMVIHELLHLKFWFMDINDEPLNCILVEQLINEFAPLICNE